MSLSLCLIGITASRAQSNDSSDANFVTFYSFGTILNSTQNVFGFGFNTKLFSLNNNPKARLSLGLPIFSDIALSSAGSNLLATASIGVSLKTTNIFKSGNYLSYSIAPLISFVGLEGRREFSYLSFLVSVHAPVFKLERSQFILGIQYKSNPIVYKSEDANFSNFGVYLGYSF